MMSTEGYPPIAVMITVDIAMITIACGLCAACFIKRKSILEAGAGVGVVFLIAGFIAITAPYAADLYTVTLLSLRVGRAAAMEAMAALHTHYSWSIYLFAWCAMACGIYLSIRTFTRQSRVQEKARSATEESEARFANAQQMAHLGSWDLDIETGRATWSDELYLIFGYQPGAIEPSFDLLKAAVHPVDRDAFVENFWHACEESHNSYENEYRLLRNDGSHRFICSQAEIVLNEAGKPVKITGTVHDITERKQAEQKLEKKSVILQVILDTMDQGISVVDADLNAIASNAKFLELLEFPPEFGVGTPYEKYIRYNAERGEFGPGDIEKLVNERVELAKQFKPHRFEWVRPDGTVIEIRGNPSADGGFVTTYTDITERKQAEAVLRSANETAEYANRSKSEFLANMNHERCTPLNAITSFSEMMRLETFGPVGGAQYREYVRDIHDLSKIEAGELELNEVVVDVAQVVSTCQRIIEGRAKEAGLTLPTLLSGDLPRLWSDGRAVKQIVLNLLSNAVKFTPAEGEVTVRAEIDKDGCFVLSVSDTGIGIDADDIPKIFTPFSQIDGSLSRKKEGTGLGLSLVKSLVDLHGGTIELESELGDGTIATIRFPAERVVDGYAETTVDDVEVDAA